MSAKVRQIASGDTITADVLRDFLLAALRHEAIRDALLELIVREVKRDRLHAAGIAAALPTLIVELVEAADPEDWREAAAVLIEDAHDSMAEGGAPE